MTSENGKKGAHPLGMVLATYHRLSAHLETVWHSKVSPDSRLDPEIALHLAGSARRGLPTCGDLDAVLLVPDDYRAYDPLSPSMWPADVLGVEERAPEIAEIAETERGVLLDALGVWVPPSERESYAAQNGF